MEKNFKIKEKLPCIIYIVFFALLTLLFLFVDFGDFTVGGIGPISGFRMKLIGSIVSGTVTLWRIYDCFFKKMK